jgi:hypothetical protein
MGQLLGHIKAAREGSLASSHAHDGLDHSN